MTSVKDMVTIILVKKDWSQKELAQKLGVAESRIGYYLTGARPRVRTYYKIKQFYAEVQNG